MKTLEPIPKSQCPLAGSNSAFHPRGAEREDAGRARGFTLVELLVVIAIIGVLVGLTIPAIQGLRELSRRAACSENLTGLSLALSAYHVDYGHFPAGSINPEGPIRSEPNGYHHNWISGLLPMLDAQNVYDAIDRSASVYAPSNEPVRQLQLPFLQCPSATMIAENGSSYAGNHHPLEAAIDASNQGVFFLNETISNDDVSDGLSYTIFVGEKMQDYGAPLSWMSGTRSTLRNAGHSINAHREVPAGGFGAEYQDPLFVGGFSSWHTQGAYFLDGAGGTRFIAETIDLRILQQLADRADGEIPLEWQISGANGTSNNDATP